jgi:hypothetical protein
MKFTVNHLHHLESGLKELCERFFRHLEIINDGPSQEFLGFCADPTETIDFTGHSLMQGKAARKTLKFLIFKLLLYFIVKILETTA